MTSSKEGTQDYRPFAEIALGTIFRSFDKEPVLYLKTNHSMGVSLAGVWAHNQLIPRGTLRTFEDSTCVTPVDAAISLSNSDKPPFDPRRCFWAEGNSVEIGCKVASTINVFQGLFICSGFGMGRYFSSVDNERFFIQKDEAEAKAFAENIPFVQFSATGYADDPDLTFQRQLALRRFNEYTRSLELV